MKGGKSKSFGSLALAIFAIFGTISPAEAATGDRGSINVNFADSSSRTRSQTVSIPEKALVTGVTVNTGSASYSQSGRNVTVNVSGGASTGSTYDPYMYSQSASTSQTSSTNSFPSSVSYSNGGYSGTLFKNGSVITTGSLVTADSKSVTRPKADRSIVENTLRCDKNPDGTTMSYNITGTRYLQVAATSIYYNEGGYSGNLYRGVEHKTISGVTDGQYCPAQGRTTTSTTTIQIDYTGTVSRPASDTRQYTQNYNGTIYMAGGSTLYGYTATVNYVLDESAPTGTLSYSPTGWTNGNVVISLTGVSDVGTAGLKSIRLPNGTVTTGSSATYTVSTNGTYTFTLEDNVGNTSTRTATITNIDKTAPSATIQPDRTTWTNTGYGLELRNVTDSESGVKRVMLPNGTWVTHTAGAVHRYLISANGTYTYRIEDNAGNVRDVSHSVTNMDTVAPTGTVSYDGSSPNTGLKVNLASSDATSGVKEVTLPSGAKVAPASASFTTKTPGTYTFVVEDNAGNKRNVTATVEEPDFTVVRDGLDVLVTVNSRYTVAPVTTRKEDGRTWTAKSFRIPVTKDETFTFTTNDGGIPSSEKSLVIENYFTLIRPQVDITYDKNWTKNNVVLTVSATSPHGKGILNTQLPNGTFTTVPTFSYTATENGVYTFITKDVDGQLGFASVVVSNIDKKAPTVQLNTPPNWVNRDVPIDIQVTNN